MTILCGTDFSELGQHAATAAAQLALRGRQPLELVHVLDCTVTQVQEPEYRQQLTAAEQRLAGEATRLRGEGVTLATRVLFGKASEALLAHAVEVKAELLVLGAHARADARHLHVGSTTDVLAAAAGVPVLVVRDPEPFSAWNAAKRPLRVVLGADDSSTTDAAMGFVASLRALGECEVLAVHLFWPPEQFERLGLGGSRSYLEVDPKLQHVLTDELVRRVGSDIPIRIEPHLGNLGERLVTIAAQARADLIVTGSHGRLGASRVWHGSVSRDVLHSANVAVACVPAVSATEKPERFQSALVAVDFSEGSAHALALACTAVPAGGTIHLAHVVPPRERHVLDPSDIFAPEEGASKAWKLAQLQLERLSEQQRKSRAHEIKCHVLESSRPADAIAQAAERLHADLICVGTRGGGRATRVFGSTAEGVLSHTRRPVLFAQAPRR